MKITEYPKTKTVKKTDVLLLDGERGTQTIEAKDLSLQLGKINTDPEWVTHKNVFRGKNLGEYITDEQLAAIQDGSFEDLYVGDYWVDVDSIKFYIADINYFYSIGDSKYVPILQKPHIVVMPDNPIDSQTFNPTETTSGGYSHCQLLNNFGTSLNKFKNIFGENCVKFAELYSTGRNTDTKLATTSWFSVNIAIPNSIQALGYRPDFEIREPIQSSTRQFSLFRFNPNLFLNRNGFALRDIATIDRFSAIDYRGNIVEAYPTGSYGLCPYVCIG